MFAEFFSGLSLGAASILTNVCLLPLYPGMIAFLAGNADNQRARGAMAWLGLLVLAGVLTLMLALGVFFYLIQREMSSIFPVLLPLIYVTVIVLGGFMLAGRSPFERLTTMQAPVLRNPYAMAYVYGLLLAPMTLPCAGPVLTTGLVLAANNTAALAEQLLYFLGFGLGFGWPLVLAAPAGSTLTAPFSRRADAASYADYARRRSSAAGDWAVRTVRNPAQLLPRCLESTRANLCGSPLYPLQSFAV
ncbi:MAG: cytochrome c biogenesis protein CcdA [Anaerolineae bacterium]